jgi:hypothetical protein
MQVASPTQSAPLPAQAASALTAPTPTKQSTPLSPTAPHAMTTPAAPPAATATHAPAGPVQTERPAQPILTTPAAKTAAPTAPTSLPVAGHAAVSGNTTAPIQSASKVSAQQTTASTSPVASTGLDSSLADPAAEEKLSNEVDVLWKAHTEAQGSVRKSREELKEIRANLSARLRELKSVLSRPGRGGAWSSFLETQKIPRSSADRLVRSYEKTLGTGEKNCTAEQIHEATEVTVRRYMQGLWPRLSRVLATRESVELFIAVLRETAEKSFAASGESSDSSV